MIVEYRDGELAVDEPVKDFHGAALKGCDECADFLGRSADISVGSVGSMDGWTSVLDPHRARPAGLPGRPGQARRPRPRRPGRPAPPRRAGQEDRRPLPAAQARPRRPAVHRLRRARAHLRRHRTASPSSSAIDGDRAAHACTCRTSRRPGPRLAGRPSLDGADLVPTCCGPTTGCAEWLWSRWSSLEQGRHDARRLRRHRGGRTGASSGSGWPASGSGPSAARDWSAGSAGALAQVAPPGRVTPGDGPRPGHRPARRRRPPRGCRRPRRRRLAVRSGGALGDSRPQRFG